MELKGITDKNKGGATPEPEDKTVIKTTVQGAAEVEADDDLDMAYVDRRSITISLVTNYSLYRKTNDKSLPKRRDVIGSSIRSSRTLSSNKGEVEAYFPNLIGLAPNNEMFVTRVKAYLNNISVPIDELGKTFDTSFRYNTKRDYLKFKAKEDRINEEYASANRQDINVLREALEKKINDLTLLESEKYKVGVPVNVSDYLIYRHCLLYRDVAKDTAFINSDQSIRFYFRDDKREADLQAKLRLELNNAKSNYVKIIGNSELFDAVFVQYCVMNNIPVTVAATMNELDKQNHLDKYSIQESVKFNKICNDKDLVLKSFIENLIARGELNRATHNQNITTYDGEFIGANVKEAVAWFKNPANNARVDAWKNKLKHI